MKNRAFALWSVRLHCSHAAPWLSTCACLSGPGDVLWHQDIATPSMGISGVKPGLISLTGPIKPPRAWGKLRRSCQHICLHVAKHFTVRSTCATVRQDWPVRRVYLCSVSFLISNMQSMCSLTYRLLCYCNLLNLCFNRAQVAVQRSTSRPR